jgi:Ca2+-binding RTX toxin-like protein
MTFPANIDLSILDGSNGFRLNGAAEDDFSGVSVASAGDVNGDGLADVIVGANGVDADGVDTGAGYVVFGRASGFAADLDLGDLDGSDGFRLDGVAAFDRIGLSVASAGDVNGDGFADVIIGGYGPDPNGSYSGASYVVFGKASGFAAEVDLVSLDGSDGFRLSGAAASDFSGGRVGSAGDVNGDGYGDLIVGATGADANGASSGAGYVVFGKASGFAADLDLGSLDGSDGFRLSGAAADDFAGISVESAGDVNGDGLADLIVGATGADPSGNYSGASYVVFGQVAGFGADFDLGSLDGSNGFRLGGVAAFDRSGTSVASAGDINGDGFSDLIVGATGADPNGAYSGASYVVFGQDGGFGANIDLSSLDGTNGFRLSGAAGEQSGYSVASAGDFNGDGFADLIVGAPGASPNGDYSGATYLVFGKASGFAANLDLAGLDGGDGFRLSGVEEDDYSGGSVASAGDVNGDGFADLIVGANRAAPHGFETGASYVVFGGAFGGSTAPVTTTGTAAAEMLIGGAGDDTLSGGGGGDVFHGGAGDDRLVVGDVDFRLVDGGGGTDTLALDGSGLTLYLDDRLVAARVQGIERIDLAGSGDNTLTLDRLGVRVGLGAATGGQHVLTVEGDAGDTVLFADRQWNKSGSFTDASGTFDRYVFGNAVVNIEQGVSVPGATIDGTSGDDIIGDHDTVAGQSFATNRDDTIYGHGGNDWLDGRRGADILIGSEGDDTYTVDNAGDVVTEEADEGIDSVRSTVSHVLGPNVENLRLLGGMAIDGTGNALDNAIIGNGADNVLAGLGGADTIDGGNGIDTASYVASTAAVYVSLAGGLAVGGDADGDALLGIENLVGSSHDDALTGNGAANGLSGGDGHDFLAGGAGIDTLFGNDGDDLLDGGAGGDFMLGGAGNDTYVVDNALDVVDENSGQGTDTVQSSISYGLGSNFENLVLLGGKQIAGTGNGLDNVLTGNGAANRLSGNDGDDRLIGGGGGTDVLTGGDGMDTFVFTAPTDGLDTIADFQQGSDLLEFSAAGFGGGLVAGFTPQVVNAARAASAFLAGSEGYFILDNAGPSLGTLYWDATGGSGNDAVAVARLTGVTSLAASDVGIV